MVNFFSNKKFDKDDLYTTIHGLLWSLSSDYKVLCWVGSSAGRASDF
jgi:hypothetical protein